ncbi:hypothetical protein OF83DRAFT_1127380 [Amylostereum chailletii]|nr:hypothetical protein OF83DRAFT_1127380 [Amylostereum chailletii]
MRLRVLAALAISLANVLPMAQLGAQAQALSTPSVDGSSDNRTSGPILATQAGYMSNLFSVTQSAYRRFHISASPPANVDNENVPFIGVWLAQATKHLQSIVEEEVVGKVTGLGTGVGKWVQELKDTFIQLGDHVEALREKLDIGEIDALGSKLALAFDDSLVRIQERFPRTTDQNARKVAVGIALDMVAEHLAEVLKNHTRRADFSDDYILNEASEVRIVLENVVAMIDNFIQQNPAVVKIVLFIVGRTLPHLPGAWFLQPLFIFLGFGSSNGGVTGVCRVHIYSYTRLTGAKSLGSDTAWALRHFWGTVAG